MFIYDVETASKKSDAVILSMACIYFDPDTKPSPQELRDSAFFAKFDVEDQIKNLNRTVQRSTMEWWAKQCDNVKNASFKPSEQDIGFIQGYEAFCKWVKSKNDDKCWIWARGNLDQLVLDSIVEDNKLEVVFPHYKWRDVRTAVDFLYGTQNGYCDVDYPGFDSKLHITKHNPIDDCVLDAMQLMYGVKAD